VLALSLRGRSGDTVLSYMLWVILKTSIISPHIKHNIRNYSCGYSLPCNADGQCSFYLHRAKAFRKLQLLLARDDKIHKQTPPPCCHGQLWICDALISISHSIREAQSIWRGLDVASMVTTPCGNLPGAFLQVAVIMVSSHFHRSSWFYQEVISTCWFSTFEDLLLFQLVMF